MRARKRSGAYHIVNEVNGKSYVGSSVDVDHRWAEWRSTARRDKLRYPSPLVKAFQKYGLEHFTFILLEECEPLKHRLEALEQHYIDLLKPQYNILPRAYSAIGNKSRSGQRQSAEERRKHSAAQKANMADPEKRARISRSLTGVKKTYDVYTKGKPRPEETKQKIREAHARSQIRKEQAEARRGKPNLACSRSGEYGIRWRSQTSNWAVTINGKSYGAYKDIADARIRRDYILSLDHQDRKPNRTGTPNSNSCEYGITWRKDQQKWLVRIKGKTYGQFALIADAIVRRDQVLAGL